MPSKLADVSVRLLSIRFERFCRLGEVPDDWRKANVVTILKKRKKKLRTIWGITSCSYFLQPLGEIMEQILSEVTSGHMKGEMMTGNRQSDLPWIY